MLLPWCLIWDRHPSFWEASDFQEAAESLTMLDYNGRSLLHKAAMEDDTEILDVSWLCCFADVQDLQATKM